MDRPLTAEQLEGIVRHHAQAELKRDIDEVMETVADEGAEWISMATGEVLHGKSEVRKHYLDFMQAFPDARMEILNIYVDVPQARASAVCRWCGAMQGPLAGMPPRPGRIMTFHSVQTYEIDAAGKIKKEVTYANVAEFLQTAGLVYNTHTKLGRLLLFAFQSPWYAMKCIAERILPPH